MKTDPTHNDSQNTGGAVSAVRAQQNIQARFNPIRNFTPSLVTRNLNAFRVGRLREVAWLMDVVQEQDDTLKTVVPKRLKSPSRLDFEISPIAEAEELGSSTQIEEQKTFLQRFFNRLETRHALERHERGGWRKLIRQMMDATAKKYAVHEIQWQPMEDGSLTARCIFTPLWFFENETGELRFLASDYASEGVPLEDNGWMVTIGDGLMIASLVLYTYKSLPLKDWLGYSENNGRPFIDLKVNAQPGTAEWEAFELAVQQAAVSNGLVRSVGSELNVVDLTAGNLPYEKLVERCDRFMTALWRGSDLSTMSGKDKMGASLQQDETDILLEDDVEMLNETINEWLVKPALKWKFGEDVQCLVNFNLKAPDRLDEKAEQDKLHAAAEFGVAVPVAEYRERLNIPGAEFDEVDELLAPPSTSTEMNPGESLQDELLEAANAGKLKVPSLADVLEAQGEDFAGFREMLDAIEAAATPKEMHAILQKFEEQFDAMAEDVLDGDTLARALQAVAADAVIKGALLQGRKLPSRSQEENQ